MREISLRSTMKVLFIGGTKRGYLTLKALVASGAQVSGIISLQQDEHEVERFEQPIQALALSHGISCYHTKALKDRDYAALISEEIKPDVAFVVGCRILLPKSIYGIPRIGTLAVHDSLLPNYRGFAPLNWAVINGETQTGVTLFYLDERMDGGDIGGQKTVEIGPTETAAEVYERICASTVDLVLEAHAQLSAGREARLPQDYNAGSFTCSRTPDDGVIDWNGSTHDIYNRVRALTYPYPGAFTFYRGERLIVWAAQPGDSRNYVGRIAGRVIEVSQATGHVDVLTGDGILRLLEVELDGNGKVSAAEVIKSVKSTLGFSQLQMLSRLDALKQQIHALTRAPDASATEVPGADPSRVTENK